MPRLPGHRPNNATAENHPELLAPSAGGLRERVDVTPLVNPRDRTPSRSPLPSQDIDVEGHLSSELRVRALIKELDERQVTEVALRDALEQGRLNEQELRRGYEEMERFVAILAHDLRNPLSAIRMTMGLLGGGPEERRGRLVERVNNSVDRMQRMITQLLDFTRSRRGGIPAMRTRADMEFICRAVLEELRAAHPERALQLECTGNLLGEWDSERLAQALSNLVGNAIIHGADPVHVRAYDDGTDVITEVTNAGPPIPPARLPGLFSSLANEKPQRGGGLGLGLYIADQIAKAHGGTLSVCSTASHGTTFTGRWPRKAS